MARLAATLLALAVVSGDSTAQPPTAPPPREKSADTLTHNERFTGFWVGDKAVRPVVETTVEGGRVQVRVAAHLDSGARWSFTVSGSRAVVRDGVLILTGLGPGPHVVHAHRRSADGVDRTTLWRFPVGPDTRLEISLRDGAADYHDQP
jgi:hypothetical protein